MYLDQYWFLDISYYSMCLGLFENLKNFKSQLSWETKLFYVLIDNNSGKNSGKARINSFILSDK